MTSLADDSASRDHIMATHSSTENFLEDYITATSINVTDAANVTVHAPRRNEKLAKIEIAVQGVILCLAIIGNGLVLIILGMRRKKLSRMNMMIVHLSIADLFVAFFNVLPQMMWDITNGQFKGGDFLCRSVKYFQVVAMYASSYVLVTTAIDRYLAICHPLTAQTWSNRKTHLLVALAWGLSLVLSMPQIFIFAFREQGTGVYNCWALFDPQWTLQAYITFITLAIYIIPFIILAAAYGRICIVVWRSMMGKEPSKKVVSRRGMTSNRAENGTLLQQQNGTKSSACNPRAHVRGPSMSRAKVRTVKLTLTVIICYLICWGPFFITQMWAAWDPYAPFEGQSLRNHGLFLRVVSP